MTPSEPSEHGKVLAREHGIVCPHCTPWLTPMADGAGFDVVHELTQVAVPDVAEAQERFKWAANERAETRRPPAEARLRAAEILVDVVRLLRDREQEAPGQRDGYLLGVLFARLDAYDATPKEPTDE